MKKWNYYNEWDPYCAQWIRNLIAAGHIPDGEVDERSIEDVTPDDVRDFVQVHMFAGIAGWSLALRLAGWPDSRPCWTGSAPCQPFSSAGKGAGFADERHLWPAFHHLIRECKPSVVFGEQVASKDGLAWIDLVLADLEASGYASGANDLCAAGVEAPHIRQRIYWLAHSYMSGENERASGWEQPLCDKSSRDNQGLEYAAGIGWQEWRTESGWRGAELRRGTDGITRPIESRIEPLAHGVSARMDKLRGYGNAIVPHVGAEFIAAYWEALGLIGIQLEQAA